MEKSNKKILTRNFAHLNQIVIKFASSKIYRVYLLEPAITHQGKQIWFNGNLFMMILMETNMYTSFKIQILKTYPPEFMLLNVDFALKLSNYTN